LFQPYHHMKDHKTILKNKLLDPVSNVQKKKSIGLRKNSANTPPKSILLSPLSDKMSRSFFGNISFIVQERQNSYEFCLVICRYVKFGP